MEFPGGPVVRTWWFHCHGPGSIPSRGTKLSQAVQHSQKEKRRHQKNFHHFGVGKDLSEIKKYKPCGRKNPKLASWDFLGVLGN